MHITTSSIAPIVACLLAYVRFLIPIKEVLKVRKEKQIGELNPVPFAAAILNTTGWVVYAVLTSNLFIFLGDGPGLLCSIWMTFSLYPHASRQVQDRLNGFLMTAAALWCCLAFTTIILQGSSSQHNNSHKVTAIWGWAVSVTQVMLMASPLSTIYKAIKERSSSSFHLGLCIMGAVTSFCWTIYALVIHDMFVMVPNMIGGILSVLSVLACLFLSRVSPRTPSELQQTRMRAVEQAVELG